MSDTFTDASGTVRLRGTAGGDAASILLARVDLSAADILDLDNTAVECLPAAGGRFYYVLHRVVSHYRFVTTPYNETAETVAIGFGTVIADITDPTSFTGASYAWPAYDTGAKELLQQTEDAYADTLFDEHVSVPSWLSSVNEGQALSIASSSALTGGDGTLTLRLWYSLLDGTP